jgi:hypothetical protein
MGRKKLLSQTALSTDELRRVAQILAATASALPSTNDGKDETWPKTISEWCRYRRIGRTNWYRWKNLGIHLPVLIQPFGPKGVGLITREADAVYMRITAAAPPAETNATST